MAICIYIFQRIHSRFIYGLCECVYLCIFGSRGSAEYREGHVLQDLNSRMDTAVES